MRDEELEKKVKESIEAVIGKEPYDFEKVCNGARLPLEAINQLRKNLGLPPRP